MVSLIARVDTNHRDMIHDAQMDYYGTKLATCSSDRIVKIFEVKPNGQQMPLADLIGHEGPVWQVSWSHPMYGSLLASCSYDRKVIIWKEAHGKWGKLYEYSNHDASVNSLNWAPVEYGLLLACGSSDGSVSILSSTTGDGNWEAKKIQNAHAIGCNSVSWCPSLSPGAAVDPNRQSHVAKRLVTGGCDTLVKIWKEGPDGQWVEERRLEGHKDWVRDVAWAPSIGLPHSTIASCSQDQRVIIWTNSDLENSDWSSRVLHTFDDVVWHVSWSLCGTILAVSAADNKITLWKQNLEGQWICISDTQKSHTQPIQSGGDSTNRG